MKIYGRGTGGRHRNDADARRFRDLVNEIRPRVIADYPLMGRGIAGEHAFEETRSVLFGIKRRRAGLSLVELLDEV